MATTPSLPGSCLALPSPATCYGQTEANRTLAGSKSLFPVMEGIKLLQKQVSQCFVVFLEPRRGELATRASEGAFLWFSCTSLSYSLWCGHSKTLYEFWAAGVRSSFLSAGFGVFRFLALILELPSLCSSFPFEILKNWKCISEFSCFLISSRSYKTKLLTLSVRGRNGWCNPETVPCVHDLHRPSSQICRMGL